MVQMDSPVNILIAFPYFKKDIFEYLKTIPKTAYRLIVDSGAFTAWNIGKVINLDDYCRFLDSIDILRPFNAVQLDVFGEPDATWKNFLIMKQRGYDVMPVFTRGDTLERLEEMYSYTDYIMFGGITVGGKNLNYVKWFMEKNKGRKIHWLGFCNVDFVKFYKPHSIDSSSWASGGRFGNIPFYSGFGKSVAVNRKQLLTTPDPKIYKLAKRSGITKSEVALLQKAESWTNAWNFDLHKPVKGAANFFSAVCSVHRALDIEKHLGTRFYLAAGMGASHPSNIFAARNFLIERGVINGQVTDAKPCGSVKVAGKRGNRLPTAVRAGGSRELRE